MTKRPRGEVTAAQLGTARVIHKMPGFQDYNATFWANRNSKRGSRYQCKFCGKVSRGMRPGSMHFDDCPTAAKQLDADPAPKQFGRRQAPTKAKAQAADANDTAAYADDLAYFVGRLRTRMATEQDSITARLGSLLRNGEQQFKRALEELAAGERIDAHLITNLEQITGEIARWNLIRDLKPYLEQPPDEEK